MVGKRKKGEQDSTVWFSKEDKSGVLIQHSLNRCIYFVKNIRVDTLDFSKETPASEIDKWVDAKRKDHKEVNV